ncbi:hypothetical protein H5410_035871 [Solanum commersonii]|uniref:Reverse transcriptase zinc-binding domain-containing protein n=1 Tax=Solanum commersonii TaxID=4109 RepID=A0A9J5Y427_SOLCO|nr:hypothetical protein H5410_035871 [Solanum commersonii]
MVDYLILIWNQTDWYGDTTRMGSSLTTWAHGKKSGREAPTKRRGTNTASGCFLCKEALETNKHLFLHCIVDKVFSVHRGSGDQQAPVSPLQDNNTVSGLQIREDVLCWLGSNNGSFKVSAAYRMMNLFFNLETLHNDEPFQSTNQLLALEAHLEN